MSQNQEIIESKLCAYIDGELDPEGRAEIEKHLEANPQHRRLLESLRATRDLIRWLPREPAPPELAETLSGQLERSVLLNYEGDSLRINFWPRLLAAAAIILLTAGLGVAVFYALPRSQKPQLAMQSLRGEPNGGDVVPAPPAGDLRADSTPSLEADRNLDRELTDRDKAGPEVMKKDGTQADLKLADENRAAGGVAAKSGQGQNVSQLDQLAEQVAQNPTAFLASAEGANNSVAQNSVPPNYNALVVLVRSSAPERTGKQLTGYLNQQQILYRQPAVAQQLEGSIGQQRGWGFPSGTAAGRNPVAYKGGAPEAPAPAAAPSDPAATQPSQKETYSESQTAPALQGAGSGGAVALRASNNYVYVCQMSRSQAEQLSSTIGNDAVPGNQVQNLNSLAYFNTLERGAGQNAAPNAASNEQAPAQAARQVGFRDRGAEGEMLSKAAAQTEPSTGLNPVVREKLDHRPATTQPAGPSSYAVNAPANVAGKKESQVSQSRQASIVDEVQQLVPAASQPATNLGATLAATTGPADEPLNVVILVQSSDAPAAATAIPAATQPSDDSLPQKARAAEQPPVVK